MSEKLEDEVRAGQDATYLIEHPIYTGTINKLRSDIEREWRHSPARDADGRERLWVMLKLLERVDQHIKSIAQTGKLAAGQLAKVKSERDSVLSGLWRND